MGTRLYQILTTVQVSLGLRSTFEKKKKKCPPPARTTDKIFKVCASDNNNKPKGLWFKSSFRHLIWHSSHKKKNLSRKSFQYVKYAARLSRPNRSTPKGISHSPPKKFVNFLTLLTDFVQKKKSVTH